MVKVQTKNGEVEGLTDRKAGVHVFQGIPYAQPPVGNLRWAPPVAADNWTGVKACKKTSPAPWQLATGIKAFLIALLDMQGFGWFKKAFFKTIFNMVPLTKNETEDCLVVDVRAPTTAIQEGESSKKELLPVMVWFYGGDHQDGSTNFDFYLSPHLASQGVVHVNVNYRVGVFAWYAHPELEKEQGGTCGNYGLMDQLLALQWVQDNIHAFGGDKNNVTIFGESAGGESVMQHMHCAKSKGLFHKAIAQSPACLHQLCGLRDGHLGTLSALDAGVSFADRYVGTESGQVQKLRNLSGKSLADHYRQWALEGKQKFYPTIGDDLLPHHATKAFCLSKQHDIPLMIGYTDDEGSMIQEIMNRVKGGEMAEGFRRTCFWNPVPTKEFLLDSTIDETGEWDKRGIKSEDVYKAFKEAHGEAASEAKWRGDIMFAAKAHYYSLQHAKKGQDVFHYVFRRVSPSESQTGGAYHGAEIPFVFGSYDLPLMPLDASDQTLSNQMVSYWTTFAKTGNPNSEGQTEWTKFSPDKPDAMSFDVPNKGGCTMHTPSRIGIFEYTNQYIEAICKEL